MQMAPKRAWCVLLLLFSTIPISSAGAGQNNSTTALDAVIRDHALRAIATLHTDTGVLYEVPLTANFSGMEASVIRLRSGSLWTRGVRVGEFNVPPGTIPQPFARRLVLVYQDLGNWSASYYRVPGHSAVTPVVGLLAYAAPTTNSTTPGSVAQLDLTVTGDPISVRFARVSSPQGAAATTARCAGFGSDGSVQLGEVGASNVCSTRSPGHFAIVVPVPAPGPGPTEEGNRAWRVWVVACGGGVVGLALVGLAGAGVYLFVRNRRLTEETDGEALRTMWVMGSKMPSAAMMRTLPALENNERAP